MLKQQFFSAAPVFVFLFCIGAVCGDDASGRPLWTTSKISGSPEPPPPLKQVVRYPNLKFSQPLYIERDPADLRMWVVTRDAKVLSFPDRRDVSAADLFIDLREDFEKLAPHDSAKRVNSAYGLAFHPEYPKVPVCWLTYTLVTGNGKEHLEDGTRLSRFHISFDDEGVPHCDPASEKVVLSWTEGGHNGACLKFGPDGYLYITAGDGEVPNPPDPRRAGQNVTNFLSTILRIDVNPDDDGPLYRIPPDNPFPDDPASAESVDLTLQYSRAQARPEIWAYGFRNPWKMNFGPDGQLWVGDVGWELYEMVYNVKPGGNYGWSIVEGPHTVLPEGRRGPTPIVPAAIAYSHSEGASVTGGFVYQGSKFPELRGRYIFGDYETRRIWSADITPQQDGSADTLTNLTDLVEPSVRIVAFGEDTQCELLLLHFDEGTVYELERNEAAGQPSDFPKRLSETGLFADTQKQLPADGLVAFEINAEMWRDSATAAGQGWLGIPGEGSIEVFPKARRMQQSSLREQMHFPTDTVLAQNITLTDDSGQQIRLETQVLHFNGRVWNGYTYVWNPEQTDADLAPAKGLQLNLSDYSDFADHRTWNVHSRSECIRCHNSWAGGTLAFTIPQLNRKTDASDSASAGQIESLQAKGILTGAPLANKERLNSLYPVLVNPSDDAVAVSDRARSYLSVNCSHCHQRGAGGSATIDLRHNASDDEMKTIAVTPAQGTFQIADAAIITPGEASKSVLYYRMACSGRGRMPHVGSEKVDVAGLNLVRSWIASLPPRDIDVPVKASLTSTSSALELLQKLDAGQLGEAERDRILKEAREAPPEIRNIFVRFQPEEYRQKLNRTLNSTAVLALKGNPQAGAALFQDKRIQCINCHRINGSGGQIAPALDDVGRRLSKEKILESVLEPSKNIDPKFMTWTALTTQGRVHSGLLVRRDDKQVTLRTAKNENISMDRDDVEELLQQTTSLMPDRLLNDLTDQQIADLIAWLSAQNKPTP